VTGKRTQVNIKTIKPSHVALKATVERLSTKNEFAERAAWTLWGLVCGCQYVSLVAGLHALVMDDGCLPQHLVNWLQACVPYALGRPMSCLHVGLCCPSTPSLSLSLSLSVCLSHSLCVSLPPPLPPPSVSLTPSPPRPNQTNHNCDSCRHGTPTGQRTRKSWSSSSASELNLNPWTRTLNLNPSSSWLVCSQPERRGELLPTIWVFSSGNGPGCNSFCLCLCLCLSEDDKADIVDQLGNLLRRKVRPRL
jgi:hypothetical protein